MSQMPDKIWLHKDTKYNTGDIVCGYQYEFAEGIEDEGGIDNFVEYVPKDAFIKEVCEWLENHNDYQRVHDNGRGVRFDMTQCIFDLRKAMKGK